MMFYEASFEGCWGQPQRNAEHSYNDFGDLGICVKHSGTKDSVPKNFTEINTIRFGGD